MNNKNDVNNKKIILVVIPTMENAYHNLKHFVSVSPPVGLTSVAATALREGYDVSVIDGDAEGLTMQQIVDTIAERRPAFVGSTVMTATMDITTQFFTLLKKRIPEAKAIIGGPHVSALPEQTLTDIPAVDIGVIGEGDYTIVDILKAFENNTGLNDIAGIVYRKNGSIVRTAFREPIKELDSLPMPAHHLLNKGLYKSYLWSRWVSGKTGPLGVIFTARGCTGRCNFCAAHTVFGRGVRYFSIQKVIEQLEFFINEWGIKILYIQDDTFTLNRKRIDELCNYLICKGYNRKIEIQVSSRVNTVYLPTMRKMRRAGIRWVFFGIESGNPEILKIMDKNITLKQIHEAIRMTRKAGIFIGGNYIIGNIGETHETAMDTINLSCRLDQDYASYATAIPLPGTGLYEYCLQNNIALPCWNDFGSVNTPPIPLNTNMDAARLKMLRELAVNRFFKRPIYLLRLLVRMKTFIVLNDFIRMYFALRREKTENRF